MKRCKYCGKNFKINSPAQKYCSKDCSLEGYKDRNKIWKQENKSRIKRVGKKYYLKNRERYIKNSAKWQKENRERYREIHRKAIKKLLERNPSYFRTKSKNYYHSNKMVHRIRIVTNQHRKEILEKFDYKCCICGLKGDLELHHISYDIERIKEKKNWFCLIKDKVLVLCKSCHKGIHKGIISCPKP